VLLEEVKNGASALDLLEYGDDLAAGKAA